MNLILGMPRSRTAWLSMVMSSPGEIFEHEGFAKHKCHTVFDYRTAVKGDSTTLGRLMHLNIPGFETLLGQSNVVVVFNDPYAVANSWKRILNYYGYDIPEDQKEPLLKRLLADQEWLNSVPEKFAGNYMCMHATDMDMGWPVEHLYRFFNDKDIDAQWLEYCKSMNVQMHDIVANIDEGYLTSVFKKV